MCGSAEKFVVVPGSPGQFARTLASPAATKPAYRFDFMSSSWTISVRGVSESAADSHVGGPPRRLLGLSLRDPSVREECRIVQNGASITTSIR
jgi:hypothetical protein